MTRAGARPRLAVLGAGHVGPVIARVAVAAGYHPTIAASAEPERIELIARVLAPGAEPRWAADAVDDADVVVLAIPIHKFAAFDSSLVAGKIVVDAMNYWPPVDGVQELFEDVQYGSSEIVQRRLDRSTVVKALNHIGYHELDDERRPVGSPEPAASSSPAARSSVLRCADPSSNEPSAPKPPRRRGHSTFRSVPAHLRPRHLRRCHPRR